MIFEAAEVEAELFWGNSERLKQLRYRAAAVSLVFSQCIVGRQRTSSGRGSNSCESQPVCEPAELKSLTPVINRRPTGAAEIITPTSDLFCISNS